MPQCTYGTEGNTHEVTDWRNDGRNWISEQVNFTDAQIRQSGGITVRHGDDVLILEGTVTRQ